MSLHIFAQGLSTLLNGEFARLPDPEPGLAASPAREPRSAPLSDQ
jgi:hypothetical protein